MTAQHTPGPWRVVEPGGQGNPAVYAVDGISIANVGGTVSTRDPEIIRRRRANAQLIASAPDLLSALQDATDALAMQLNFHRAPGQPWVADDEEAAQLIERFRRVIDKAEGRGS